MEKSIDELKQENAKLHRQLQRMAGSMPAAESGSDSPVEGSNPAGLNTPPASFQSQGVQDNAAVKTSHAPATPSSRLSQGTDDNAYAAEVGYLTLNATGEARYLGSSSGIGLANMISSAISAQSGMSFSVGSPESTGNAVQPFHITPLDPFFPSLTVAAPFLDAYFKHTHVTFPLIHRASFMVTVDRIYQELGYYETNPFAAFVFDMVLAIGSSNFNVFEDAGTNSSTYYAMAQNKISRVMSMDGLSVLKAILLICQHAIFSNLRDTSASIWHLIGVGSRLCFELGLHIEPKQLNRPPTAASDQSHSTDLDQEMRRRCFWCLYNLDRIVSSTLGRPLAIRDAEVDVSLPRPLDSDESIGAIPSSVHFSPFVHLIGIRRITGQILSQFYNSRHGMDVPLEEKMRVRQRFYEEIVAWKEDTKQLSLHQNPSDNGFVSSFWSEEWYTAVYSNALLLLYRPSPYLPYPTMTPDLGDNSSELIRLLRAAGASIESYGSLHRKRRLNYSWITLHGVFLAGLAYVYSVGRILRDPAHRHTAPDTFSVIDITRGCSNVLVAICERWNVSRRSCALFDNLSNAVIRDSLNAGHAATQSHPSHTVDAVGVEKASAAEPGNIHESPPVPYYSVIEERMRNSLPQLDEILAMDEFSQSASFDEAPSHIEGMLGSEVISDFASNWTSNIPPVAQGSDGPDLLENSIVVDTGTESIWAQGS
ncbi:hypothetical protein NW762_014620 [Fusarium torreyae]|uniref:Xylanolytic transcriptional activator regulatory domain-containing protein n=1 Tax=Fusarium torreyae TaxID=1237075 RepID=A0A9W8RIC2_9HYPO|nr:hypothetical protein NW762_014620 [Fusarium torreyae]